MSVPHLLLPVRLVDGVFATNEQDTRAEVADCVLAIALFPRGFRLERPAFGLPDQTFRQGGADPVVITSTVARLEPRANALTTQELVELVSRVQVNVRGGD